MKLSIIFLISLLTNLTLGKNVIKCSKTELGKNRSECETYLEKVRPDFKSDDSNAKNGEAIKALIM